MIELINMSDAHIQNVHREITRLQSDADKIGEEIARLKQYVEEATATVEKYRSEMNTQTSGDQTVADSTFTLS